MGSCFHIICHQASGGVGFVSFASVASTHLVSDTGSGLLLRSMALDLGLVPTGAVVCWG